MRSSFPFACAIALLTAVGCTASPEQSNPPEDSTLARTETASSTSSSLPSFDEADPATPPPPAAEPPWAFHTEEGVAVGGADTVAYFTQAAYVPGTATYTHQWGGALWQFASAENRDAFAREPERYAPQYGGYCAWAVSQGYTAPIDPRAWNIVDGKLYLNVSPRIQTRWERDIPGHIAQADANWPQVLEE